MGKERGVAKEAWARLARDLLDFYDAYTALNARSLFVLRGLVSISASGDGEHERVATGAIFSVQELGDRMLELEQRLKAIHSRARAAVSQPD